MYRRQDQCCLPGDAGADRRTTGRRGCRGPRADRRGVREGGPDRADRGRGAAHRRHRRPLRRGEPARLLQPDPGGRRGRRLPEGAGRRSAVRRALPRRPAHGLRRATRSRSSASATACPRATCRGSAASRCSSPRWPTRSSPAARSPTRRSSAGSSRSPSSRSSSTRAGTCSRSPGRPPASRRASIEFLTVPTGGSRDQRRAAASCRSTRRRCAPSSTGRSAAQEEAGQQAREGTDAPPGSPGRPLDIEAHRYVVHVRNGSGANGLAGRVLDQLVGLGFVRGTVDNTAATPTSVVRYRDSDDAAEAVAGSSAGIEPWSRTTPCPPGTCRWCWVPTPRGSRAPAPTPPPPERERRSRRRAYRASTDRAPELTKALP